MRSISIAGRVIGPENRPYIIAEMSGNHMGDLFRARRLVEMAAQSGADALKLQTYTADTITLDHDGPDFRVKGGLWDGRRLYDLYGEAHTPWAWHEELFALGRKLGITIFSSPFDPTAVDFLDGLGAPAFKIASFEAVDLPLITYAASKGKPLIISTGMCGIAEISMAIDAAREGGCEQIVLLHCVSGYPAPASESNLRTMAHMQQAFDVPVGLSDHTLGTAVATAASALGAAVIEKHITLSRAEGGVDSAFSLEPDELASLVRDSGAAFDAVGSITYRKEESEKQNLVFRRSLYAVADIAAGEMFTEQNVRSIRPGYGLAPKEKSVVIGSRAARDIKRGEPLSWSLVTTR
jgi:pseudaminic acid synthase